MIGCPHTQLHAQATPYVTMQDGDDIPMLWTVHLAVSCTQCGAPFRFEGDYLAPPPDIPSILAASGPWSSAVQDQIATRIRPFTAQEAPFVGLMEGKA